MNSDENIINASAAFSTQAPLFDSYDEQNPILQWMRKRIYWHVEKYFQPGDSIFELNAGTGIDAVYFARKGYSVFAIDNAAGMVNVFRQKRKDLHLEGSMDILLHSFTDLRSLPSRECNHVFSNFGGLNCIPDLTMVTSQLHRFLRPGGTVTFVVMPPVSPWELLHLLKGNWKLAFRRFHRNGTPASIEGKRFLSYYFSPKTIEHSFDSRYRLIALEGLASVSPPPFMDSFAKKNPAIYSFLTGAEQQCSDFFPFNRWADHCIVTMRYLP